MTDVAAPSILVIENDPTALAYLKAFLQKLGYSVHGVVTGKDGLVETWRQRPGLVLVERDLPDLNGLELVQKLRADPRSVGLKIILLANRATPDDVLAGMQAGADEYLLKRRSIDVDLRGHLEKLLPLGSAAGEAEPPAPVWKNGKIISFLSAKGGTGTSSLCANIAHGMGGLVAAEGKNVAVVDLVLPIGSIAQIVGAEAPQTVITVSQRKEHLLEQTAEATQALLTTSDVWQFHVLAGAPDPAAAQALAVDGLDPLFTMLRRTFDYVLVDFGRALSRVSLPFIRASARVVLILSTDVSANVLTQTVLKYLETQDIQRDHIYPILNRAVGLEGLSRAEIEQTLGLTVRHTVPHARDAFTLANNYHHPFVIKFPNDSMTLTLREVTTALLKEVNQSREQKHE